MKSKIRIGGAIAAGIVVVVIAGLYSPSYFVSAWSQLSIPGYPGPDSAMVTATPLSDAKANDGGYPGPGKDPIPATPIPGKPPRLSETVGEAVLRDAKSYSSMYGTDLEESVRRIVLQSEIGELNQRLAENEPEDYGGLFVEHTPMYRVVVQFTQESHVSLEKYAISDSLKNDLVIARVEVSFQELERRRESAAKLLASIGLQANSGIDVRQNQVLLYVTDLSNAESMIAAKAVTLPGHVELVEVAAPPKEVTNIGGGLALNACTSGFSVVGYSPDVGRYVRGITTAGHCSDSQAFAGVNLPFVSGTPSGVRDIQWHRAEQAFNVTPTFWDGFSTRYVRGMRLRAAQFVGDVVCRYGVTTGYGCGTIVINNYDGLNIQVQGGSLDHGDSGGPWFIGNTALGTSISIIDLGGGRIDSIYGPVDHIAVALDAALLFNWVNLPMLAK